MSPCCVEVQVEVQVELVGPQDEVPHSFGYHHLDYNLQNQELLERLPFDPIGLVDEMEFGMMMHLQLAQGVALWDRTPLGPR